MPASFSTALGPNVAGGPGGSGCVEGGVLKYPFTYMHADALFPLILIFTRLLLSLHLYYITNMRI